MARYIPTNFAPRLYDDWYLLIEDLTPVQQAEVMRAIFKFPNYTPKDVPIWKFIASRLQDQYDRFLSNKEKRTEAAKKGAQARWGDKKDNGTPEKSDSKENTDSRQEPENPVISKMEIVEETAKTECINQQFISKTDNPDIIAALRDPASGLSIFLETGAGYDDALTRPERDFADRTDVRALCAWHRDLMAASKEIKKFAKPTLDEWLDYCRSLNLDERVMTSAYESYAVADWHDTRGAPIRNWKQKILQVWNKPEHISKMAANFNNQDKTGIAAVARGAQMAEQILKKRGLI